MKLSSIKKLFKSVAYAAAEPAQEKRQKDINLTLCVLAFAALL